MSLTKTLHGNYIYITFKYLSREKIDRYITFIAMSTQLIGICLSARLVKERQYTHSDIQDIKDNYTDNHSNQLKDRKILCYFNFP